MKYLKPISKYKWNSGCGDIVFFDDIIEDIRFHTKNGGNIYIGADSQIHGTTCTFVTAICLHGGDKKASRYYFKREPQIKYPNRNLRNRINEEVTRAIDVFLYLSDTVPDIKVEIHIDIGSTEKSRTRTLVDSITGWVKGFGVPYKIKPDAWASAAVADRHTK